MSTLLSRRKFLKLAAAGAATLAIPSALTAYAAEVEPYAVELTELSIPLANLPARFDGMRIVQASDFHMGEWITVDHMLSVVQQIQSLAPDLIVLTGDIFGFRRKNTPAEVIRVLSAFSAPDGVLAIMGNRDYYAGNMLAPQTIQSAKNIQLLVN